MYYIGDPPVVVGNPISMAGPGSPRYCYFVGPKGYSGPLFSVQNCTEWQFQHGGEWTGFGLCGTNSGTCTGIRLVNTGTIRFRDMAFLGCAVGLDNVITAPPAGQGAAWSERVHMDSCTFTYNGIGIRLDNQAAWGSVSFGYERYLNLEFNTPPGGSLFKLLGGPVFYSSSVSAKGNMSGADPAGVRDSLFDMTDGSGIGLYCDVDIHCEGAGTAFLGPGSAISGHVPTVMIRGNLIISSGGLLTQGSFGAVDISNQTAGAWQGWGSAPLRIVTLLTTKAVASEAVSLKGTTCLSPYCQWLVAYAGGTPMNMAGVKAAYANGAVTITHPAVAGSVLAVLAN